MLFRSLKLMNGKNIAKNIRKKLLTTEMLSLYSLLRSEERRVGKSVDLGGRRIIKKNFFQAEDGIRDIVDCDWSSDVCSSDLKQLP